MARSDRYSGNDQQLEQERLQVQELAERAILVAVHLPGADIDDSDPLGELRSLAETAGATVVGEMIQNRRLPASGTYLGRGKLDELKQLCAELRACLVVFDNDLSPAQIRNIESVIQCKIIDRSELILDIFAGRATTNAAKLQVELAQLEYTYPRLRAMWSHLGQIVGGAPIGIGTRGPGETQIETDRRIIQQRKAVLRRRIGEIHERKRREVAHRRQSHYTVCLVGYTNAGKSSLFNALTGPHGGGGAYADNRLFATLTTRTRNWPIGGGNNHVLLSDTVGFVADLPHHLIASFRATLEEALCADLLLIVIDVANPQAHRHYEVVEQILNNLLETAQAAGVRSNKRASQTRSKKERGAESGAGANRNHRLTGAESSLLSAAEILQRGDPEGNPTRILLLNKVDLLPDESEIAVWHRRSPATIAVSAITGRGFDAVRQAVLRSYHGSQRVLRVTIALSAGRAIAFVENRAEVLERNYDSRDMVTMTIRLGSAHLDQLRSLGGVILRDDPV